MINGVTGAIIGIHNIDLQLSFWRDELGYEVIESGIITADVAKVLYKVDGEIQVWSTAPAKAESGQVWFYKTANSATLPIRHPHTSELGNHALDLYTKDALATHSQLSARGWKFPGLPEPYSVPLGEKEIEITEGFCFGPEGTDVVFVEAKTARSTIAWDANPDLAYTELTSVVCGVKDMETAKEFYGPNGLGMSLWYDVTLSSPGIEKMAQLPPGTQVQLAFMSGSKTARVEIINTANIQKREDIHAHQRLGVSLGHNAWSFKSHDLEAAAKKIVEKGGRLLSLPTQSDDPVHGRATVITAETPEGSVIEIYEVRK